MAKTTGIAQFATGRKDIFLVDPCSLVIAEVDDYRDKTPELEEHIDNLAKSIAEIGVRKPIEVKLEDGKIIVKEGRCRARAAIRAIEVYKAELKAVPVISVDRYANEADLILNQFVGNSGKPFTSLEQAKIFKKLLDMGWNQSDISKKTGLSNGRVSQILNLLTMPAQVQAAVASGAVSASLAQSTVRAAETPQQAALAIGEAVETAKVNGRSKVRPEDVPTTTRKFNIKECLENSEIDCSQETVDNGYVIIKMPVEDWELIRKALGL